MGGRLSRGINRREKVNSLACHQGLEGCAGIIIDVE
jgi:hypothetical protein